MHYFKFYAKDKYNNWNSTLPYLNFTVYGLAYVDNGYADPYEVNLSDTTIIYCHVRDDSYANISGYNVSFYGPDGYFGWNTTNDTGWAQISFTPNQLGYVNVTCNISDWTDNYYKVYNAEEIVEVHVIETTPPHYNTYGSNTTKVHKGDAILLYAEWADNYLLDYAWVESNETGSWLNASLADYMYLGSDTNWSNFTIDTPLNVSTGIVGWRIWANDTSSNTNMTPVSTFELWAWVGITDSYLDPPTIPQGNSTLMRCKVEENNGTGVANYNVSFWSNETGFLGWNLTNASGWAELNFSDSNVGTKLITCNITNDTSRYYEVNESMKNSSEILTVLAPGSDTTPPSLYNDIYDINESQIYKGDSVLVYARWNETIGQAYADYNTTSSEIEEHEISLPSPNPYNWTNHTIVTNSSWATGVHYVKIRARDTTGNWNNSLSYLTFEVWGRSAVEWVSPTGAVNRTLVNLTCKVYDYDNNSVISNYSVAFYDSSYNYLGSAQTNDSGYAKLQVDLGSYPVGPTSFTCTISDDSEKYYEALQGYDTDTGYVDVYGWLNTSILSPLGGSYFKGQTVQLNSTTFDEKGAYVTPDSVVWRDEDSQIATGENTTWTIPSTYEVGIHNITVNSSKQYYHNGINDTNITVYGWVNATWISPSPGSEISQGSEVNLTCRIIDANSSYGVEDYVVMFWIENSTSTFYLGTSLTNSTGYATKLWDTSSYAEGIYYPKCNITDNTTLYYYAEKTEDNTTVNLTAPSGWLEVYLWTPPNETVVGQNRTFVLNASVTCRGGNCGTVTGTARYNASSQDPDTAISTTTGATPFYTSTNPKSCGTLSQDQSCNLSWSINATGGINSTWKLDVLFQGSTASQNNTNDTVVQIGIVIIMNVTTDVLDRWYDPSTGSPVYALPPLTSYAESYYNPVNVSIDPNSNDADGIWIRGTNLTNNTYIILVGNVSWNRVNNTVTSYNLTGDYQNVVSPAPSGTNQTLYFWISVPGGIPNLLYDGIIYIMANASG